MRDNSALLLLILSVLCLIGYQLADLSQRSRPVPVVEATSSEVPPALREAMGLPQPGRTELFVDQYLPLIVGIAVVPVMFVGVGSFLSHMMRGE